MWVWECHGRGRCRGETTRPARHEGKALLDALPRASHPGCAADPGERASDASGLRPWEGQASSLACSVPFSAGSEGL